MQVVVLSVSMQSSSNSVEMCVHAASSNWKLSQKVWPSLEVSPVAQTLADVSVTLLQVKLVIVITPVV